MAALNGAGVAVSVRSSSGPGDRKRHDKGGEPRAGPSAGTGCGLMESTGPGKAGKQKHREERSHPPEVVPSILERPVETASPDVVTMKRPQSPRGTEGSAVHGEGGAGDDANGGAGAVLVGAGEGARGEEVGGEEVDTVEGKSRCVVHPGWRFRARD